MWVGVFIVVVGVIVALSIGFVIIEILRARRD
jgi:hypothetical protein